MPVIPGLWEAEADKSLELRSLRPAWPAWRNPISTKNTKKKKKKISQVWWPAAIAPTTWESEAQEVLEPGRQRLQWAQMVPLHSSLGDKVRLCLPLTFQKGQLWAFIFCLDHHLKLDGWNSWHISTRDPPRTQLFFLGEDTLPLLIIDCFQPDSASAWLVLALICFIWKLPRKGCMLYLLQSSW